MNNSYNNFIGIYETSKGINFKKRQTRKKSKGEGMRKGEEERRRWREGLGGGKGERDG